jgi:hypothetical protein
MTLVRIAPVDRLVTQLGDVCGEVADLAAGQPPDSPELRQVREAVREASDAIRIVVRNPSAERLPIVLAAWKAIAHAREVTAIAHAHVLLARRARVAVHEQRTLAQEQARSAREASAHIAAAAARAHAGRLERWLERRRRLDGSLATQPSDPPYAVPKGDGNA